MRKEIWNLRIRFTFMLIIGLVLFFIIAPFQNKLLEMLKDYKEVIEKYGMPIDKLKNWDFFILSQWYGKNLGQMIPIVAIIMAFPLFSREYENNTMEFLLVRLPRKKVFFNKLFVSLIFLILLLLILEILPYIYSVLFRKSLNFALVKTYTIHQLVGGILWFSVAFFFSVLSRDQVKPLLLSFGILAITTALGMIKKLRFLNVYLYILEFSEKVKFSYSISLLILSGVLIYLSYFIFKKIDI